MVRLSSAELVEPPLKLRSLLAATATLLAATSTFAQSTVVATFAGQEINLVIPKGYCVIPRDDVIGREHYELQEKANKGHNVVGVLFSDCAEWRQRQTDGRILRHHGNYLFQMSRGQEVLGSSSFSRADLIQVYVDHEKKTNGTGAAGAKIADVARERLKTASKDALTLKGPANFGMVDRNEDAAFMAIGATVQNEAGSYRFVGVVAATLAHHAPVTINLYSPPDRKDPFGPLLRQQKALVRTFLSANGE